MRLGSVQKCSGERRGPGLDYQIFLAFFIGQLLTAFKPKNIHTHLPITVEGFCGDQLRTVVHRAAGRAMDASPGR